MKAIWTIAAAAFLASCSSAGTLPNSQLALRPDLDRWTSGCPVDAMTDRPNCTLHNMQARILVSYDQGRAPRTVCVIGHDFPGRTAQIRIDGNAAITTNRDGCTSSAALVAQLKTGASVTVRYYGWPYDYPVDAAGSLAGFSQAVQTIDASLAR